MIKDINKTKLKHSDKSFQTIQYNMYNNTQLTTK